MGAKAAAHSKISIKVKRTFVMSHLYRIRDTFEKRSVCITILLTITLGFLAIALGAALLRHSVWRYGSMDFACYVQAIWKVANGKMPYQTVFGNNIFLGGFRPIGFALGFLFRAIPSTEFLLVLQSVFVAIASIPLFLLAKDVLGSKTWAMFVAFSYLGYRPVYQALFFDFHPDKFAIFFLAFAFYFMHAGKGFLSLLFTIPVLASKEYFPFSVFLLGSLFIIKYRQKTWSFSIIMLAILWLYLAYGVIMPEFGGEAMLQNLRTRYPFAEASLAKEVAGLLSNPSIMVEKIFRLDSGYYFSALFSSLLFIPMFGLEYLIPAIPILGINIISEARGQLQMNTQYQALVIPIIFIALIFGLKRLRGLLSRYPPYGHYLLAGAIFLIILTSLGNYRYYAFKLKQAYTIKKLYANHAGILKSQIKRIPADAKVAANFKVMPYLAQRDFIYSNFYSDDRSWLEDKQIDYIIFDRTYEFHWKKKLDRKREGTISYIESLQEYEKVFDREGIVIFRVIKSLHDFIQRPDDGTPRREMVLRWNIDGDASD